jgi:hypothetical protein
MKLPHVADLAVTKFGGVILGKRIHAGVRAIYRTRGRTIKRPQDMQQGALSRARLPYDGQHRAFRDLKRQILKEHEFGFA